MQEPGSGLPLDEQLKGKRERLQQLRTARNAYRSLISKDPPLPSVDSPLPALLALRATGRTIDQTKRTIRFTHNRLTSAQTDLSLETRSLKEIEYLSHGLRDRIDRLRLEEGEQATKKPEEITAGLISEQKKRRSFFSRELRGLVKAFNMFVNSHLAIMLAAEDLGGPVVGDALDLVEENLEVGFTQQGKPKKIVHLSEAQEKKRLVRNSQTWGDEYVRDKDGNYITELEAAGACFRDLTEDLLNAFANPNKEETFIRIEKENAAVKFLIRANVAQFHPKDAQKLCLR